MKWGDIFMLNEVRSPIIYVALSVFCLILFYAVGQVNPSFPALANLLISFWFVRGCLYMFELWKYEYTSLSYAAERQFASFILSSLIAAAIIIVFALISPNGLETASFVLLFIYFFVPHNVLV